MIQFKSFVPKNSVLQKALVCLSLLCTHSSSRQQQTGFKDSIAIINDTRPPQDIIKQLHVSTAHFIKLPNRRMDIGLVGNEYHAVLLKFISNDTLVKNKWLSIDNTSLDTVFIFKVNEGAAASLLYQGGNLVPFDKNRNYVWHTAPITITSIPSFYLVAVKAAHKNINFRYDMLDGDTLHKRYAGYQQYVFFYMGIITVIAIVMLIAFLLFRKAVFCAYLGYITCAGGWILTHYGCIFPMLYPDVPIINEIIKPVTSLGASLFLIIVLMLVFRNMLASIPALRQVLKISAVIILLIIIVLFFLLLPGVNGNTKIALIAAWQVGLTASILLIIFTPLFLYKTGYTAKIFSAAVLVICVMTIVQQFANLGYITNFFINEHGLTVASVFEIAIMAFGLFYGFYREKKESEKQVFQLEKERTETLQRLIMVQDNERKRIAADLHDNLGPLLAALKINFRRIVNSGDNHREELVEKTETIIDDSLAEIRNVAHNLMPKGLSANGLVNTLNDYFTGIEQLYKKQFHFVHEIEAAIPAELQTNLYRIICELVLNAVKHSEATLIEVTIKTGAAMIMVNIRDDGQGFEYNPDDENKAFGLHSSESRVHYLKGTFHLQTHKGKGTSIAISIPLQFNHPYTGSF